MALDLLHFLPEARVAEKLIESAEMLGCHDQADYYSLRYRAAFPIEYARWAKANPSLARVSEIFSASVEGGMRTLKMDGMEKIMMGLTDIKMVRSVCIK